MYNIWFLETQSFLLTVIWGEHHHSAVSQPQLIKSTEQPPNLSVHKRHSSVIVLTDSQLEDTIQNTVGVYFMEVYISTYEFKVVESSQIIPGSL